MMTLVIIATMVFGLMAMDCFSPRTSAGVITLRCASTLPDTSVVTIAARDWVKKVEQRTNGRVTFEIYPAGQLYKTAAIAKVLSSGALDFAATSPTAFVTMLASVGIVDIGPLFDDTNSRRTFFSSREVWKIWDTDFKQKNMKLMFPIPYAESPGPLTTNKQVRVLEDLKGLKIRGPVAEINEMIELLGAVPTYVDPNEAYTALQQGTVDGIISGLDSYVNRRWYEVCKYCVDFRISNPCFFAVGSLLTWNKLPIDIQRIMLDAAEETHESMWEPKRKMEEGYIETMEKAGVVFYQLPPAELQRWQNLLRQPMKDEFVKKGPQYAKLIEILDQIQKK